MDIDWNNWLYAGQVVEAAINELHKDGKMEGQEYVLMANSMKYGATLALVFYAAFTKNKRAEIMDSLDGDRKAGRSMDVYGDDTLMVILNRIGLLEEALMFFGLSADAIKEAETKLSEKYPIPDGKAVEEIEEFDPSEIHADIKKILSGNN